jgi:signal transduction histidine kinase
MIRPQISNKNTFANNADENTLRNQLQAVLEVSQSIVGVINIEHVLSLIIDQLGQNLGYKFPAIFLLDAKGEKLVTAKIGVKESFEKLIKRFFHKEVKEIFFSMSEKDNILVRSVREGVLLKTNDLYEFTQPFISRLQTSVMKRALNTELMIAVPLLLQNKAVGVLGASYKKKEITNDEISVLQTFANQISIAIYNAQLFSRVQRQVVELTEQAKNMSAMHELSSLAGSSLNKMKVLQGLLDQLPSKLGHLGVLGGSVLLHRPNTRELQPAAFTKTPEMPKVLELVTRGKINRIAELVSKIDDSQLLKDVFDGKKAKSFLNLHEMFPNTVSERMSRAISKMGGIGSFITFPVIAGQKVYGVVIYYLTMTSDQLNPRQKEILQVCTNHVASSLENSSLFEQLGLQYKTVEQQRKQLTVANTRLQALDKTKSEFISIASHQLRTPLTVIKGYLSLILEGTIGACDTRATETLKKITGSTDRLVTLVNDLLDISRIERGTMQFEMKSGRLEVLAKDVFDELAGQARGRGLAFTFTAPHASTPLIPIDPIKLRQSILNLIDNAIKYTPSGSIEVAVYQVGQEVRFSVKDTGIGMTESTRQNLFQKFNRGEGVSTVNTEGVGLGLFVAKQIVDRHGGVVTAESAGPGKGSTFTFSLPIPQAKKRWYNKQV